MKVAHTRDQLALYNYVGCSCMAFSVNHIDITAIDEKNGVSTENRQRLSILLQEWHGKHVGAEQRPLLEFETPNPPFKNMIQIKINDLLPQFPETVAKKIERSFVHLAREGARSYPGYAFHNPRLLFQTQCGNANEYCYFIDAMKALGWIDARSNSVSTGSATVVIAPGGWQFLTELEESGNRKNPVFVAMWFGGDERATVSKQEQFFEELHDICMRTGWRAERSDSPEYNDSIIDKIIFMIRQAPFVIADLSDENQGAYFEAGFAKGLGRDVIYLVKEDTKKVHFDLSGMNQVRWGSLEELHAKLENRILGTKGRGPHNFDEKM